MFIVKQNLFISLNIILKFSDQRWHMINPSNQRLLHQQAPTQNPRMIPATDQNRFILSNKKLENINCIFKPSDTLGGLYLGDIISTLKEEHLKYNNIRAILTCMHEKVSINPTVNCHKILPIKDILEYPIIQHFDDAVAWITQKRKQKHNVLVHCHAGVSRSATIVIAYLIRTQNWSPFQAFEFVKQQRDRIKPNASFWNQINEYYNYWSRQGVPNDSNQKNRAQKSNQAQNAPHKTTSEQIFQKELILTHDSQQCISSRPPQFLKSSPTKNGKQSQNAPVYRRRKIFDQQNLQKSNKKEKQTQGPSQYYINQKNPEKVGQFLSPNIGSSIQNSKSQLMENKYSAQSRYQSIFKPSSNPSLVSNFSTIRFQNNSRESGHYARGFISPDIRTYFRSP